MNTEQMSTCYGMPGYYEVKSNFTLYLDCIISEDIKVIRNTEHYGNEYITYEDIDNHVHQSNNHQ